MKIEYSYGAVLYKIIDNEIYYLVEHMVLGHNSLPKGHIEAGETKEECVRREIKEELNLTPEIDFSVSYTINYHPKKGVKKYVTFYTGRIFDGEIIPQEIEVKEARYYKYNEALKILTHKSDRRTLKFLNKYIIEKEKNNETN